VLLRQTKSQLEEPMRRIALITMPLLLAGTVALADEKPLKFWNLTSQTITALSLAPAGTANFGPNQCLNDPDKSVDVDERLKLTGVTPGRYDVKLTRKDGRTCTVPNVELRGGAAYAFSIDDKQLTDCKP
jgi:hypothetical protein